MSLSIILDSLKIRILLNSRNILKFWVSKILECSTTLELAVLVLQLLSCDSRAGSSGTMTLELPILVLR